MTKKKQQKLTPCDACPWRLSNQHTKHPFGFFSKTNLRRLWGEICSGGHKQSCHKTDPGHPAHLAMGTPKDAKPIECAGSVILIWREMKSMASKDGTVTPASLDAYRKARKKNGIKRSGLRYWLLNRFQFGNVPGNGGPLPEVNVEDEKIGLPDYLAKG